MSSSNQVNHSNLYLEGKELDDAFSEFLLRKHKDHYISLDKVKISFPSEQECAEWEKVIGKEEVEAEGKENQQ